MLLPKIRAIDMVWKLAQPTGGRRPIHATGRKGDVAELVRGMLPTLRGQDFTLREVSALAEGQSDEPVKKSSISSALRRLADEHALKIVAEGKGKRATVYRVAA